MTKEIILYNKFINNRYNYIKLLTNGFNNALKNKDTKLCKILIDEIKKDIEIIELLKSFIEKK